MTADKGSAVTHAAWVDVMRDVGSIEKNDRNREQGFNFRGVDATVNSVGPAFREHGVAVLPVGVEILESERYKSSKGTPMHGMVTRHDWLVLGPGGTPMTYPDGSPVILQTLGQAADSGDKAATKAASVAHRTVLLQALAVPTGDRDPDADTHERGAPEADPRQEWWDRILALAATGGQTQDAVRKHYREKIGHEIDGPEATVETLRGYHDRLADDFARQRGAKAQQAAEAAEPVQDPTPAGAPAGRDPRQTMWDEILAAGAAHGRSAAEIRADFRVWSTDQTGGPFEIDGDAATPDHLVRYLHFTRGREQ